MQDEIWRQRSIQNYNGAVLSVYSVVPTLPSSGNDVTYLRAINSKGFFISKKYDLSVYFKKCSLQFLFFDNYPPSKVQLAWPIR